MNFSIHMTEIHVTSLDVEEYAGYGLNYVMGAVGFDGFELNAKLIGPAGTQLDGHGCAIRAIHDRGCPGSTDTNFVIYHPTGFPPYAWLPRLWRTKQGCFHGLELLENNLVTYDGFDLFYKEFNAFSRAVESQACIAGLVVDTAHIAFALAHGVFMLEQISNMLLTFGNVPVHMHVSAWDGYVYNGTCSARHGSFSPISHCKSGDTQLGIYHYKRNQYPTASVTVETPNLSIPQLRHEINHLVY